jgi:acetolactate synthase I/II/III large subunit
MRPWRARLACVASALPWRIELGPAIQCALAERPALLDVIVTSEAASSDAKTGLAWVPDLQPLAVWNDAERKWRAGE